MGRYRPVPHPQIQPLPGATRKHLAAALEMAPQMVAEIATELVQGWVFLQRAAGQVNADSMYTARRTWLDSTKPLSTQSPLVPISLGVVLFALPLVVSLVAAALQLALLGIAGAHWGPLVVDRLLHDAQQAHLQAAAARKKTKVRTTACAADYQMMAGVAAVLAIGYFIGTVGSLVILASSVYGCVCRGHDNKGAATVQTVQAQKQDRKRWSRRFLCTRRLMRRPA